MIKNYFTTAFVCLISVSAFSQSLMVKETYLLNNKNRHEISLFVGFATYQGDLHNYGDQNLSLTSGEMNTAVGLGYTFNIVNELSVGFSYFTTKISGDDSKFSEHYHKKRGFSFTNRINEFSLRLDYEPFQMQNPKFLPYVFGGVGIVTGDAKTVFGKNSDSFSDSFKALVALDIQNKKNTSLTIPLGLGLRYYLSNTISIKLEASLRVGMNDYLDGVSITGNAAVADYFGSVGLSFVYGFGPSSKSAAIQKKSDRIQGYSE